MRIAGSVLLVRDQVSNCFDTVSRALYAAPSCAERVYEKIYGRQTYAVRVVFELMVSAYIFLITCSVIAVVDKTGSPSSLRSAVLAP